MTRNGENAEWSFLRMMFEGDATLHNVHYGMVETLKLCVLASSYVRTCAKHVNRQYGPLRDPLRKCLLGETEGPEAAESTRQGV